MTDNLRTRIAAAIMDACHGVYLDDATDAADAVISELGLREQHNGDLFLSPTKRRYVTEWEPDD